MIKLNCDLGESYGQWQIGSDDQIMCHIDMANIACGFHAGDHNVMQHTISLALQQGVSIGAHPSYPDRQGFGRRSMAISPEELIAILHYQIAALEGMTKTQGGVLEYIKPHGALYNDMMTNEVIFESILKSVNLYHTRLPLVVQAIPDRQSLTLLAEKYDVPLIFEGFADRRYRTNGELKSRRENGAVLSLEQTLEQVRFIIEKQSVISDNGEILPLRMDTLCVHGDSPGALAAVIQIRKILGKSCN